MLLFHPDWLFSMQLFYLPNLQDQDISSSFEKEESAHIIRVLRKKEGDTLFVTNGKGYLFTTEIVQANDKKCTVKIVNATFFPKRNYQLHLAVAPTKMNDRYEWFIEKATEIGIDEITPIICDHSERKIIKKERLEKIMLGAMKQSNQYYTPIIHDAIDLKSFLKKERQGSKWIAHCEENDKQFIQKSILKSNDITILIGPEGDFSEKEIALALSQNWEAITLGNTRLRTETAAIVACHSIAFLYQ